VTHAVVFHELAERELLEAASYYSRTQRELGAGLILEVERATMLLAESPLLGRGIDDQYRVWALRRFPYSLYYRLRGEELQILAVAHQRRRPFYWRGRS